MYTATIRLSPSISHSAPFLRFYSTGFTGHTGTQMHKSRWLMGNSSWAMFNVNSGPWRNYVSTKSGNQHHPNSRTRTQIDCRVKSPKPNPSRKSCSLSTMRARLWKQVYDVVLIVAPQFPKAIHWSINMLLLPQSVADAYDGLRIQRLGSSTSFLTTPLLICLWLHSTYHAADFGQIINNKFRRTTNPPVCGGGAFIDRAPRHLGTASNLRI